MNTVVFLIFFILKRNVVLLPESVTSSWRIGAWRRSPRVNRKASTLTAKNRRSLPWVQSEMSEECVNHLCLFLQNFLPRTRFFIFAPLSLSIFFLSASGTHHHHWRHCVHGGSAVIDFGFFTRSITDCFIKLQTFLEVSTHFTFWTVLYWAKTGRRFTMYIRFLLFSKGTTLWTI